VTDPSAPVLAELVEHVLDQTEELAALDAARAEAWASDVLALAAECAVDSSALGAAIARAGGDGAATAIAALSGLVDELPPLAWTGEAPAWVDAVGTARCEGAWVLSAGRSESIAFRFVDALDERHVITVDLVASLPETIGEVVVGPGDLLDALLEDDADIERTDGGPSDLAARCVAALRATDQPSMSSVVNGRVLLRRLATLVDVDVPPPVAVEEEIPDAPPRDPEDDAYALEVLARALPASVDETIGSAAAERVGAVAEFVAPTDLAPLDPRQRDAVLTLEWADWLGAVIGLVRAGAGCAVAGDRMVDFVNRCPEIDTTIPKADRARIGWAFATVIEPWGEWGLLDDDGRVTALGLTVLPAALRRAWGQLPISR